MRATDDRVPALERRLGIRFSDPATALSALTHRSWVNENRQGSNGDNERLEFLGDAVIDLAVSQRLMERFPDAREGTLSRMRAALVNEQGLSAIAREIGLGELLLLGRGEEMTGGREKPSVLSDALEAVVAAIFLEGGLPLVLRFVDRFFGPAFERVGEAADDRDYKTQVQELAQARLRATPRYRVVEQRGPDHARTFVVALTIDGEIWGQGSGRSKKEAEQEAARNALAALAEASKG